MADEAGSDQPPEGESWWTSRQTRAFAATILAPIGRDESDGAARVALDAVIADESVQAERLTVYPPQIRVEKATRRDETPRRLVWVRIRNADQRVIHELAVADGVVVSHDLNEHGSPPFTVDERTAAHRLLADDRRYRDLLADDTIEVEWFNPGHGRVRLLGARLVRLEGSRVIDVVDSAVVDLDNATILEGGDRDG
jgi:hypothetical protein